MQNIGQFISIEGGEGVGKSTFCKNLKKKLEDRNQKVYLTREPGGTALGMKIREMFLNPPEQKTIHPHSELLLVLASRSQNVVENIIPKLKLGYTVICDRFLDSTTLYQSYLGGIEQAKVKYINDFASAGLVPDITFLLDCSVETSLNRLKQRSMSMGENGKLDKLNRFDELDYSAHTKIRDGFLDIAKSHPNRIHVLDASLSQAEIIHLTLSHLETLKTKLQ